MLYDSFYSLILLVFKKTYKFYNATLIVNIFQFIVASILHYCSLYRNAQYGLVPFRVLKP